MRKVGIILSVFCALVASSYGQATKKQVESKQIEVVSSLACEKPNINKIFVGYWVADKSTVKTVIFKDKDEHIQIVMWDSNDGEEMEIVEIQLVDNTIQTTEKMASTNWVTNNTYSIIDENTLKCVTIDGDDNETIIYFTRLK